jgi:hypothetical protein
MGGYYPSAAAQIRPPENFGDMMLRVLQIKHLQQASQAQTIQNQMLEEEQQDDPKWRSVFSSAAQHPASCKKSGIPASQRSRRSRCA